MSIDILYIISAIVLCNLYSLFKLMLIVLSTFCILVAILHLRRKQMRITFETNSVLSNDSRIFRLIYSKKNTSKQEIADELGLSLPTITRSLKKLYDSNIIKKQGFYDSTGGRKANIIAFNEDSKIAIGVEMLKDMIRICALNLNGYIIKETSHIISFNSCEQYYASFGSIINAFIDSLPFSLSAYLGVYIAVQI